MASSQAERPAKNAMSSAKPAQGSLRSALLVRLAPSSFRPSASASHVPAEPSSTRSRSLACLVTRTATLASALPPTAPAAYRQPGSFRPPTSPAHPVELGTLSEKTSIATAATPPARAVRSRSTGASLASQASTCIQATSAFLAETGSSSQGRTAGNASQNARPVQALPRTACLASWVSPTSPPITLVRRPACPDSSPTSTQPARTAIRTARPAVSWPRIAHNAGATSTFMSAI